MTNKHVVKIFFLIILVSAGIFSLYADDLINYKSGVYNDDILVAVNDLNIKDRIYYSFDDDAALPAIPYKGGLLLSALPGEEREYRLNFLINDSVRSLYYVIDKKSPDKPEAVYSNDGNNDGYKFNKEDNIKIYYGYDDYKTNEIFEWDGEAIAAPKNGLIFYYAEDNAGNKS